MESLYYLVPLTLIIVAVGIGLFFWAVRSGQMDDLERPGHSILYEDDEDMIPEDARRNKRSRSMKGQRSAASSEADGTERQSGSDRSSND